LPQNHSLISSCDFETQPGRLCYFSLDLNANHVTEPMVA
jgi:hypothetical protein